MVFCGLALLTTLIVNLNAGEDASLLLRDQKTLSSFILLRRLVGGSEFSWGGDTR